jgi:protein-arginine kinase activator protein McsA
VVAEEPKVALWAIDDGIEQIRKLYEEAGREDDFEDASEIQLLRGMRDELALKLPASQKNELRERLRKAIEAENYELAAILRDELRMLRE